MALDEELSLQRWLERVRERTPARILQGRAGASYRTRPQLKLREAHAAAADAVRHELNLQAALGEEFCANWGLWEVTTEAQSKAEFLLRPDKGRRLSAEARSSIVGRCTRRPDLQVAIGDGLSVAAVAAQVPKLLPLLVEEAHSRGWRAGQTFVVRHCRVGVMNDVGDLLSPKVMVLLIGERPGLATAESVSAYMAYEPRAGQSDADRNLVSNIHRRGTTVEAAAGRIIGVAEAMMRQKMSGTGLTSLMLASPE